MTTEPAPPQTGGRLADLIGTVVLLIAHLMLYGGTFSMLALMVMGTDSCAYQKCGDPVWLDRAINLGLWGGGVMLLIDLAFTLFRLIRRRISWFVPLIGCIAQLALGIGAAAMELLAGPV